MKFTRPQSRPTRVIHVRARHLGRVHRPIVYIGRPTVWGNPFVIGVDGDRDHVISLYRAWIMEPAQEGLRASARSSLRSANLACFCHPERCHGDILAAIADSVDDEDAAVRVRGL